MERLRRIIAFMACAEHGDPTRVRIHLDECDLLGTVHARSSWSCMLLGSMERMTTDSILGSIMAIL